MTSAGESESIHELLQIMDVATTLRRERELASQQLDLDAVRAQLRERLLAAAEASGDGVTPAEVEAAIERYYDSLHVYSDPPRSWRTLLAHLYIRRRTVGIVAGVLLLLGASTVWLAAYLTSEFSGEARLERRFAEASAEFEEHHARARGLARGAGALAAVEALERDAAALSASSAAPELEAAAARAEALAAQLAQAYTLRIVSRPGVKSGVDAYFTDEDGTRVSGYYLVVEAVDDSGSAIPMRIEDSELKETRSVQLWGEQVPKAVYDRIGADKQADGIVDEDVFGRKLRGHLELEVTLPSADGKPIARGRQITRIDL